VPEVSRACAGEWVEYSSWRSHAAMVRRGHACCPGPVRTLGTTRPLRPAPPGPRGGRPPRRAPAGPTARSPCRPGDRATENKTPPVFLVSSLNSLHPSLSLSFIRPSPSIDPHRTGPPTPTRPRRRWRPHNHSCLPALGSTSAPPFPFRLTTVATTPERLT
jgi:hypothetical protein